MSATSAGPSRLQSSTSAKTRNRRPPVSASLTRSRHQRMFGAYGTGIGRRVPKGRLRPPAHLRLLLAVEPPWLLQVRHDPLARERHVNAPVAEPPPPGSHRFHRRPSFAIVRPHAAIAHSGAIGLDPARRWRGTPTRLTPWTSTPPPTALHRARPFFAATSFWIAPRQIDPLDRSAPLGPVEHGFGERLLQHAVLLFKPLQPPRIRNLAPAIARLSSVKRNEGRLDLLRAAAVLADVEDAPVDIDTEFERSKYLARRAEYPVDEGKFLFQKLEHARIGAICPLTKFTTTTSHFWP